MILVDSTANFYTQRRPLIIVLSLAVILNIAGISVKFFTDDPGLYAVLARTMAQTGNFADLIYRGHDWLDKPHFPFWMAAISFKLFGITTIAYKLPALLFFFMSVVYTYKLAKKFYGTDTALMAILILLTAQHVIMSNTDVRAEPYIMGLLMGSVYHFYKVKEKFSLIDILLASLFAGCAVMTKGIYLLIPIGGAIIGDYTFKKNIGGLFNWKWLMAFILTCVFILPEIYTLYTQFDLHPEKVVFGRTGISGIRWFLWNSQFGRFNNNGFIRNTHGSVFFFAHTLLWAFAPWAIIFLYALGKSIRNVIRGIVLPEYLCLSASVLMLLIFSISKFQLPFYTNILFPFFAIITAVFIKSITVKAEAKFLKITLYTVSSLLLIVLIALYFVFAPEVWLVFLVIVITLLLLILYIYKDNSAFYPPAFLFAACITIAVNAWFIAVIYPELVKYRGDIAAAEYMNQMHPGQRLVTNAITNGLDFYSNQPVIAASIGDLSNQNSLSKKWILVDGPGKDQLIQNKIPFTLIKAFDNYPNENLTLPFIIKKRRATALNQYYLIRLSK
jgi:4-amino-4-deoxy-L-arabinose transferase-like glycosyltransferase